MRGFVICKLRHAMAFYLFFSLNSFGVEKHLVYSKHWHGSLPSYKNQEILLIYDLFTASFDANKKFSRWVAYQLSPSLVWGFLKEERSFKRDRHFLDNHLSNTGLKPKDYEGASKFHYDRGHLAPLGSFKASAFSYQLQYLSNVVPQKSNLNRGPWRLLESKIREFVKKGHELKIVAGTLYGEDSYGKPYKKTLAPWPKINGKTQQLPSGFWKMVSFKKGRVIHICSFVMPQGILNKNTSIEKYIVKRSVLEQYAGLSFFEGLRISTKDDCQFLN